MSLVSDSRDGSGDLEFRRAPMEVAVVTGLRVGVTGLHALGFERPYPAGDLCFGPRLYQRH